MGRSSFPGMSSTSGRWMRGLVRRPGSLVPRSEGRQHRSRAFMNPYRDLLRSALFGLSADRSHSLAHAAMRWALPWQRLAAISHLNVVDARLETRFAGLEMSNPVGLAAGFDKNAELVGALSTLGFGSICIGSIMPEARYGNPFPRLVRLPETESIADSMGVPSKG